jgi:xanthine dehydrogenase YagR molybdenum-binding subunit
MASQIWFGGGGRSYAWTRVTSDGRITVVTAIQDSAPAPTVMAQIAAEELGVPLDPSRSCSRTARGPYAALSAGSSAPSVGPAVRAAADAKRRSRDRRTAYQVEEEVLNIKDGIVFSADGKVSTPLAALSRSSERADSRHGRARPESDRNDGADVRRPGRRGRRRHRDRRVRSARRGGARRRPDHQPTRRAQPGRRRIIQGRPHLSEQRLLDPQTGRVLTTTLDAYTCPRSRTCRIVCEFVDKPDEHLTTSARRAWASRRSSRSPLPSPARSATRGADVHELPISREEMLRALAAAKEKERRGAPAAV